MDTDGDRTLGKLVNELARAQERGPLHRMVLNGCRVRRYLADGTVTTREEAGVWSLENGPPADRDLVAAALARETGADKKARMDMQNAYVYGFRAGVMARGEPDPEQP